MTWDTLLRPLTDAEFALFRRLVHAKSGISIQDSKRHLLEVKLSHRLRDEGFCNFGEYYRFLTRGRPDPEAIDELLDLVTTNRTTFFREPEHFDFLREVVFPKFAKRRGKKKRFLRIWSAACATGEEAYSIAMAIKEFFGSFGPDRGRVLGTDLSRRALSIALAGSYDEDAMRGVQYKWPPSYFERTYIGSQTRYRVRDSIRELVEFHRLNLVEPDLPFRHRFDVIFCRNVMIYFDHATRQELVDKLHDVLAPGGYFISGQAENLVNLELRFERIATSVFRRKKE